LVADDPGQSYQLVRDLMSVGVATCSPDTSISDIARLLVEKDLEAVVVLDPVEGHALGIVDQDDLVRAYNRGEARSLLAEDIMQDKVPQVPPDIPLTVAAQIMQDHGVRALFIMHHAAGIEYPAAFISYRHLMRHLAAKEGEDIRDLGIQAERQSPLDIFIQRREEARKRAGLK
jgi:CBS-domain-containing membrane protein